MYNMNISILGYKFNLEILILIGVIYLIIVGHTFCGCCSFHLHEGATTMGASDASGATLPSPASVPLPKPESVELRTQTTAASDKDGKTVPAPASPSDATGTSKVTGTGGKKDGKSGFKSLEGFAGANTNYGLSSPYSLYKNKPINTSSWNAPNMTVNGKELSPGVKAFLARPKQPVPLPEGEMLLFANTKFAPEYCPNTYSNSSGCAAMTGEQYNYLITRGGNNTPYSEY